MVKRIDAELEHILSDNFSGSTYVLDKINDWLIFNFKESFPPIKLLDLIQERAESFNNVQNYIEQLKDILRENSFHEFTEFLKNYEFTKYSKYENIFRNAQFELKNYRSFLTISNSCTIELLLKYLFDKNNQINVTVCESRPVMEGRLMAEKLSDYGIDINLITEAMIAEYTQKVDCAILGADKIFNDGSVLNKIGSNLIAISCKYFEKPCYVISDKSKFTTSNNFTQKQHPRSEIWNNEKNKIIINNHYFEIVENSLITRIISD